MSLFYFVCETLTRLTQYKFNFKYIKFLSRIISNNDIYIIRLLSSNLQTTYMYNIIVTILSDGQLVQRTHPLEGAHEHI